jgi:hypothetical protein
LVYFKYKTVIKHIPEVSVPITMIKECTKVVDRDFKKNNGQLSATKILITFLDITLRSEINHLGKKDVFFREIW